MIEAEIFKGISVSFAGTLLALLSAGIIWLLKLAYEKHRSEVLALARLERTSVINISFLRDNLELIDKWIESLKISRSLSCHFDDYIINEEETYKISNLELINKTLSLNYKLRRTSLDLNNMYKSYWEVILKIDNIQDENRKIKNLEIYHSNVLKQLQEIKKNYEPLCKELIDVIASIRVAAHVRKHSLFGYLTFLFRDIFPRVTDKSIKAEIDTINKKIRETEETD